MINWQQIFVFIFLDKWAAHETLNQKKIFFRYATSKVLLLIKLQQNIETLI